MKGENVIKNKKRIYTLLFLVFVLTQNRIGRHQRIFYLGNPH